MPRLLILGYVWPEPRSSAAGSRILQLMSCFQAKGWEVTFASAATRSPQAADLSTWCARDLEIALNCSSFDGVIAELQPDVVIFDRFVTEEQFGWRVAQVCPRALRVLDTEDLHSLRWARQQLLKQAQKRCETETERQAVGPVPASFEQLFQIMAPSDMAQREIASIYRCDLTLMISDVECALLQESFGVPAALLLHTSFMPGPAPDFDLDFSAREDFVAIGNFRHPPNWDAVLWLKHHLWPMLRQRLPNAQLRIYGAYQPAKATALHNPKQGFHLCGWAKDAHEVMARARVCLAPLRFGAGLKGKLLDALQCGTPSVTTSIGVEGMAGDRPWAGAVADSAQEWVAAATELYGNEQAWLEARVRGRIIMTERFDSEVIGRTLLARVQLLQAELDQHRRSNFIGAMLQHHQHKSTQYMAQWIEAKNRPPQSD
ncbi:glycosyltransferase family 4 protein [Marinimicrobium sp. ABcell2]|uniref:glycosyltransferase family 4 protein n=1 Tax=Marinimicrobium sp. ABcell2 TaxID=3069751 RepID=UPI0027B5BB94|nr:glycosyltransferase family 4 protein [Marinimicrobium sp. ABcell2]MDQ2076816.1 glycosyltransferase family 4 protein [Marinimicrobium sp. ABcell2]